MTLEQIELIESLFSDFEDYLLNHFTLSDRYEWSKSFVNEKLKNVQKEFENYKKNLLPVDKSIFDLPKYEVWTNGKQTVIKKYFEGYIQLSHFSKYSVRSDYMFTLEAHTKPWTMGMWRLKNVDVQ